MANVQPLQYLQSITTGKNIEISLNIELAKWRYFCDIDISNYQFIETTKFDKRYLVYFIGEEKIIEK